MKNCSLSVFSIVSIFCIVLFVVLAVCPFNLVDMEQAQRIAKWKAKYEQILYCFSLANNLEGALVNINELNEQASEFDFSRRILPYFSLAQKLPSQLKNYYYTQKNGGYIEESSQFYFDEFFESKDGMLISFKRNINLEDKTLPFYYMFIDINGEEEPNIIGEDIFFINIYEHKIKALGHDKSFIDMKQDCSALGSGLYCSEFYLLGGQF